MPKIGFYKSVQGAFTESLIADITQQLAQQGNEVIIADFRQGVLIDGRVYVGDICLNDLDVYFWHDSLRPAETGQDSYYIHLLRAIERDVAVINTADSTEITNDKLRSHQVLRAAGLPVSKYALVKSSDRQGIRRAFESLGSSILIKPRFGGWGSGIVRVRSLDDLMGVIELSVAMAGRELQFLFEQYYDNDPHGWVSVSMIGQEAVIGYRKPLSLGGSDWKVYDPEKRDGKGQQSEYVTPSEELVRLAQQAQRAIGKDIIGFDFILTKEGYKIVDENSRPGLYAHCLETAGVSIANKVVELILNKIKTLT